MSTITSFAPVADKNARILILGSMPGVKSLDQTRYYAHPQNSFWRIIEALFSSHSNLEYERRLQLLLDNNIALWDVLHRCTRKGSLDSSIKNRSVVVNDFDELYKRCPNIKAVYFNGTRAEQDYKRQVLPTLDEDLAAIEYHRLPSTSPAMASLQPEQKLERWRVILQHL